MTDPSSNLTLARFGELLEAYGADLARWPEAARAPAQRLIDTQPEAARMFAEAVELDVALDAYELAEPPPRLRARVLEVPIAAARSKRRQGFRVALALAFSCLVGVLSGAFSATEVPSQDDEWTELASLSFYADLDADNLDEVGP